MARRPASAGPSVLKVRDGPAAGLGRTVCSEGAGWHGGRQFADPCSKEEGRSGSALAALLEAAGHEGPAWRIIVMFMGYTIRTATDADRELEQEELRFPGREADGGMRSSNKLVAEEEGRIIGHLRWEFLWSRVPYIALIHVTPDRRRRGVGRALLKEFERRLRREGHQALFSSSQADEAEPQAWHRRMGFEECGMIAGINEGGVGEVFFRKRL